MKRLIEPRSVTLFELLIAIALLSIVLLAFSSIHIFSNAHVITADRRTKLQNEVSKILEHMTKNVQMGIGYPDNPALIASGNTFTVKANPSTFPEYWDPTPSNPADDDKITYTLYDPTHTLSCTIIHWDGSSEPTEVLSRHIITGVALGPMPDPPVSGFYIDTSNNNSTVEIGLAARFDPDRSISIDNPQVSMKTRIYVRASAVN